MTSQQIIKQIAETEKRMNLHKRKVVAYRNKLFRLLERMMALDELSGKRGLV